jgi:filamentous hemagglutinin family protein
MKGISVWVGLVSGIFAGGMFLPAIAQVTSDSTTNTIVNPNGNNFTILNGIEKGNNLFHSFSNFSVPTGGSASFDLVNTPNITTIFSRVTGGNISNIDGLISTVNSTNPVSLFLMNPNGIIFGQNAKLDISGSFVGTTANSIKFADGTDFSAVNPTGTPLLTMNAPIGLQIGQNPGMIVNRAQPPGNYLSYSPIGLQTKPGQTLALIGGDVLIESSALTAPDGHIELSSVASDSFVGITPDTLGWRFSYNQVQSFADISLTQASLLNSSGFGSGSIAVQGRNISLADYSTITVDTLGELPGGDVTIRASGVLKLTGAYIYPSSFPGATGRGSNVTIEAQTLRLLDGAQIGSNTLGAGNAGNLTVRTTDIEMLGRFGGGVIANASLVGSTGNGGTLTIETQRLKMENGSLIAVSTVGAGNSGNLNIAASESVQVSGTNQNGRRPTSLLAGVGLQGYSFGATGKAGNLRIATEHLSVTEGGQVSAATYENSDAGNLIVTANLVDVIGRSRKTGDPSRLTSTSVKNFAAGSVTIEATQLRIRDGAEVSVTALGTGRSGSLAVTANSIQLDTAGSLRSQTNAGDRGNISINTDLLQMRRGSNITTNAKGIADGGNIAINAPIILGLEDSDIIANASQGKGGNIQITTQGIIGLQYRDRLTPESDITASSQFGVNGTVEINNFGVNPTSGLVELPVNLVDSSKLIATGCSNNTGSSFVATGRGGIPENPNQQIASDVSDGLGLRTWSDIRDLSAYRKTGEMTAQIPPSLETLIQATSWHRNGQGKVELVAQKAATQVQPSLTCAAIPR